jgi:hypothetical protein
MASVVITVGKAFSSIVALEFMPITRYMGLNVSSPPKIPVLKIFYYQS